MTDVMKTGFMFLMGCELRIPYTPNIYLPLPLLGTCLLRVWLGYNGHACPVRIGNFTIFFSDVCSCCFWFSLRLGGILIGLFYFVQALIVLIGTGMAYSHPEDASNIITMWTNDINLIYTKEYLDIILSHFERYLTFGMIVTCLYMITCILFIYGAYTFHNILLIGFILAELIRLLLLSMLVTTGLLVLKQNTMDIGLLIGASVAGGFLLLGMFYLWVCALNLPVLITEMERDEQAATIAKLRQALELTNTRTGTQGLDDHLPLTDRLPNTLRPIYTVPRKKGNEHVSKIPVSYYTNAH